MALERGDIDILAQAMAQSMKNLGMGGSAGSFRAPSGSGSPGDAAKDLKELGQQAKDVEANIKMLNKQFLPFSGSLETARKLHGRMAQDLDSINDKLEYLDTALDENRVGNEKISAASRQALQEEQKKLKAMKATVEFETTKRESVGNVFGAMGKIGDAYQEIARASVQGMESISSAIQQGGSGFNLLGAAAEHQANMAQAQANMGASAMASVGQSMQGLGLAGQVAGGALNFLAQQVQHNAELRRAAARIRNQLFMQMGEKFSQSFMAAAGAGALFAGGATAMNAALDGSRITMSEFGELVKRNNEAFATSGMSFEAMTRAVGKVSANFKKSGIDDQLMRLGFSFEQQSDIIAQTTSDINKLSKSTTGRDATNEELTAAAEQSARSTALMANIMGEEAKTREKANKAAADELAYQIYEAEQSKKFGATNAKAMTDGLSTMHPEMRKIFNQMAATGGQITDASTAAYLKQVPAQEAAMREMYALANSGRLNAKTRADVEAKYAKQINEQTLRLKSLAAAGQLPGGGGELINTMNKLAAAGRRNTEFYLDDTKVKEAAEKAGIGKDGKPKEEQPKPKEDPLGDAIVNAAKRMNEFQKDMETYVVNNLPAWSKAMQEALNQMKDAYKGNVTGLNPLAEKFAWLTEFMQKYGLIVMLAAQGMAILVAAAKLAAGGLAKIGAAGEMSKLKSLADKKKKPERYAKGTVIDGVNVGGRFKKSDSMEAPGGDIGKKGMFARGREALGTDDPDSKLGKMNATKLAKFAGPAMVAMNVVSGVMNFMDGQKKYKEADQAGAEAKSFLEGPGKKSAADIENAKRVMAEAEEAKKQARADQGEGIGGAIGGAAGGAIGFALGGPIGAAVGSYLGEMAGGALGKYIGPYWDDMSAKAGEMWEGTKKAVSAGWDSFSTGFGNVMSAMWDGIKKGASWLWDAMGKVGNFIWDGIKKTPLYQLGSFIITGITGAATGMAKALMGGLQSVWDWMKTSIGNIIPDWMKNAANKVGNAVSNAYNYVTGGDNPPPAAAQPKPSSSSTTTAATAKPAPGTAEPTLTADQLNNYAYSIFLGKNKIDDVPAKYRAEVMAKVKNPPASWKPSSKPAPAQPQNPPATASKPQTATTDAGKQGAAKPPESSKPASSTSATPGAAKPPEVSKSGQVSEKDIPKLLQESLKLMEYNAKGTERMVNILASINDNAKRTVAATEKAARQ